MKNLTYPRFKAFKDDSSPAVGWKAQFYLAGTSTPATTYTDQAGSSANANPVILDGSGEADIWLDPAVSYKLVLKDENDAVQRTVDGILGTDQISSNVATGTAPFVVSSTTKVDNLNADLLDGADWASPAAIGFTTPAPGKFTSLEPQGNLTKYAWDLQVSTNDAALVHGQNSEEITLSTSGTTTDSVAILLPGNSIIDGVVARVTQAITLATDWSLGDSAQPNRFTIAQTGSQLGLGGTAVGLNHKDPTVASQALGPVQLNDGRVRVTTTGTPGQGKLRVTVFYRNFVAPQS